MPWLHRSFWLLPLIIAVILGALSWIVSVSGLRDIYKQHFNGNAKERLFLAALGFFTAALVVRGITLAIHNGIPPFHDVSLHGRHIHHLVWGILLLLTVGYAWLNEIGTGTGAHWTTRLTAMLFGIAAALTLDEFALWLNLRDVYWEHEGHESYEAMALFGGLLVIGVLGSRFFESALRQALSLFTRKRRA